MSRARVILTLTVVLAVAFVVAGAVLLSMSTVQAASFGWFAYQPLSSQMLMTSQLTYPMALVGLILVGVGLVGLGGVGGYLIGRRVRAAE